MPGRQSATGKVPPADSRDKRTERDPLPGTSGYVDVDTIRTADNIVAVISKRSYDGAFTFNVRRSYMDHGDEKHTSFFPEFMLESYQRVLVLVGERIKQLRAVA